MKFGEKGEGAGAAKQAAAVAITHAAFASQEGLDPPACQVVRLDLPLVNVAESRRKSNRRSRA